MYIGNDSYGVYWGFGGRTGWRMVERDVGSSKAYDDGPLNEFGVELLLRKFGLSSVGGLTPGALQLVKPETLEKMHNDRLATV